VLLNRCSSNWTVRVLGRGEFAAFVTYLQIEIVYQLKHRNTSYRLDLHCDRQILVHSAEESRFARRIRAKIRRTELILPY
jgi:hypothetical protein